MPALEVQRPVAAVQPGAHKGLSDLIHLQERVKAQLPAL